MERNIWIKNKKGIAPIFIVVILGVLALGVLGYINIASIVGYENIYKAEGGHVCCVKEGAYSYDYQRWLDQQKTFSCNVYTDECEVFITEDPNQIGNPTGLYSIDGVSQGRWYAGDEIKLPAGSSIKFSADFGYADNTRINVKAKLFYLKGQENGFVYRQESCVLSSELRRKTEVTELNEIPFDTCQDYIIDFTLVASKTYSYGGKEVICQSRAVYEIDELQFKDGSTRKTQGERIAYVDCCPHENNCGDDFQFHQSVERECSVSTECANGGDPYGITQTTARKFVCQDGQCVSQDFQVECTSTAVCVQRHGEGYVCDLSSGNFGECIEATTPVYCGDGYCDIGESKENCPADCELECAEGERVVTKESKVNCVLGFPVYMGCDTIVEKVCKKDGINWALIGIIVLGLLFAYIFRNQLLAGARFILSKIGVRI